MHKAMDKCDEQRKGKEKAEEAEKKEPKTGNGRETRREAHGIISAGCALLPSVVWLESWCES